MSDGPGRSELRSQVEGGLAWSLGSQIVLQGSRIVVVLVLARLLTPREVGLAGMALAVSAVVPALLDLGFGAALVQRPAITEHDRSTAFWTSVGLGAALAAAGVGLARPVADFFGEPRVAALFAVLALGYFLTALASTQMALLTRSMRFRAIELTAIASALAGAGAAIGIAVSGGGPWAIVGQSVVSAGATLVAVWVASGWRPRLAFSRTSLQTLLGFGGGLMATRLLVYLQRNVDNLLVGRVLGAAALGAYGLAYNIVLLPFGRVVDPVRRVLFPALARIQADRARLADLWLRGTRTLAALVLPALLGLAAVGPEFVHVVLGDQWHAAVPALRVLALVGAIQVLVALNAVVLASLGLVATLLRYFAAATVLTVIGFAVGVSFGLTGVAIGYAIATAVATPAYVVLTGRAIGVPALRFAAALAGVVEAALVMLGAVLVAREVVEAATTSEALRLVVAVVVGIAVYVPMCLWRAPEVRGEIGRALAVRRVLSRES